MRIHSLVLISWVLLAATTYSPGTAAIMSYQGVLYDSTGGTQQLTASMTFKIYDSPSKVIGGPDVLYWTEVFPSVSVAQNGTFAVELGSSVPIPDSLFERQAWLEVIVNGEVMSPRTRLGSAPSSFTTNRVIGDFRSYRGGIKLTDPIDTSRWVDLGVGGLIIPVDTFYYPIPSSGGWVPANNTTPYLIAPGYGTILAYGTGSSDSAFFFAEVHLPDGVKVIGLRAYMSDDDPSSNISFTFGYRGGTVATNIATLWSSGSSAAWHEITTSLNHTIQNEPAQAYFVVAVPRGSANAWGNVTLMCTRNKLY